MAIEHLYLTSTAHSVAHFADPDMRGNFDLEPPYQRGQVWGTARKVALIESVLRGVPIGALIINDRLTASERGGPSVPVDAPCYAVIDGKQRITALRAFIDSEFAVPASWFSEVDFDPDFLASGDVDLDTAQVTYSVMSESFKRRFRRFPVASSEGKLTSLAEEERVFDLINFGGVPQGGSDLA